LTQSLWQAGEIGQDFHDEGQLALFGFLEARPLPVSADLDGEGCAVSLLSLS